MLAALLVSLGNCMIIIHFEKNLIARLTLQTLPAAPPSSLHPINRNLLAPDTQQASWSAVVRSYVLTAKYVSNCYHPRLVT